MRYTEPAGAATPRRPAHEAPRRGAGRRRARCSTACSTSKDAVQTGQEFTFVAPGGQTTILYDPPESRGALRELSGDSLLEPGHDRRAGRLRGPGRRAQHLGLVVRALPRPRPRTWSSWRSRRPRTGCPCWASTCATTARRPPTSSATAASPTTRSSTRPAARWRRCAGYPRNTVPSTVVLDRQHRVAAVYLTHDPRARADPAGATPGGRAGPLRSALNNSALRGAQAAPRCLPQPPGAATSEACRGCAHGPRLTAAFVGPSTTPVSGPPPPCDASTWITARYGRSCSAPS